MDATTYELIAVAWLVFCGLAVGYLLALIVDTFRTPKRRSIKALAGDADDLFTETVVLSKRSIYVPLGQRESVQSYLASRSIKALADDVGLLYCSDRPLANEISLAYVAGYNARQSEIDTVDELTLDLELPQEPLQYRCANQVVFSD